MGPTSLLLPHGHGIIPSGWQSIRTPSKDITLEAKSSPQQTSNLLTLWYFYVFGNSPTLKCLTRQDISIHELPFFLPKGTVDYSLQEPPPKTLLTLSVVVSSLLAAPEESQSSFIQSQARSGQSLWAGAVTLEPVSGPEDPLAWSFAFRWKENH